MTTLKQEIAAENLKDWVLANGGDTRRLSTRLIKGDSASQKINNDCATAFRNWERPKDMEGLSNLGAACFVAGLSYQPGCLRSTTLQQDTNELIRLYDAGLDVTGRGMLQTHSKLYSRLKRRSRTTSSEGWLAVFILAKEKRPDLDFRRFFAHAPTNTYVDEGELVLIKTTEDLERFAEKLLMAWGAKGGELTPNALPFNKGEIGKLWKRLMAQGIDAHALLSRITGVPWKKISRRRYVPLHTVIPGHPPHLSSGVETFIDGMLAVALPGYLGRHEHENTLPSLVPNLCYDGSPFGGKRPPRADIVFDNCVIEVSFQTEMLSPHYNKRTQWKLDQVAAAGFKTLWLHYEDGRDINANKIAETFDVPAINIKRAWNQLSTT